MEQKEEKRRIRSPLPIDLTSEILLRLPEKSVARFRCVSKLWLSISTDPYFTNLFETRYPRPSLLICFRKDDNLYVSSIPQHTHTLNSNKSYTSSQPIESYHIKFPEDEYHNVAPPTESVHGLICFQEPENPIVWNPSKRQFLTLPRPRKSWKDLKVFLGYDPVEGKHKVVCMPLNRSSDVCQVLTLGSTQLSWRTVKTKHKHHCRLNTSGRCIDGVIYYAAYVREIHVWVVMSFDVRSEKFDMMELPFNIYGRNLITYKRKLVCFKEGETRLWILEDAKKHEWSIRDNLSPSSHYNEGLRTSVHIKGFTHAGEFVFVPPWFRKSSYVLFCDPVTNSYRRFEFKVIAEGEKFADGNQDRLYAFPNHIESQISL